MRILWLKSELLHPVDKGGKIRTYNMLKELKRDHDITYLTLDDGSGGDESRRRADEYCHDLVCVPHRTRPKFSAGFYVELVQNLTSPLPYAMSKYRSSLMRKEISSRAAHGKFDVIVCDFLTPSINLPEPIDCATVLFQHNVEAMIWKRHSEVQKHPLKAAYLREQWRKTFANERETCQRVDWVAAVSREDAEVMREDYNVRAIGDVPTGVDTEYFRPRPENRHEPYSLVFTGSMDWLPNDDAIRYFIEEIMPRVRQSIPNVRITVVGRNPYPRLLEWSRQDPSVVVTGRVEDVRPYIESAAAYVVPMRIGGGTRLKIYEAMAMAKPVISTTIGAEGLPVQNGTDLLLADTPEAFAETVIRVLNNPAFAQQIGSHGAATVRKNFGWDKVSVSFAELCRQAISIRSASANDRLQSGKPGVQCAEGVNS